MRLRFILLLLLFLPKFLLSSWRDDSISILLPSSLRELSLTSEKFPFFWKALYVIEAKDPGAEAFASRVCSYLDSQKDILLDYYCQTKSFKQNHEAAQDWIKDVSLRKEFVGVEAFESLSKKQLALASLPGTPREFVKSLRLDPIGELPHLYALRDSFNQFKVAASGYLMNEARDLIVIPMSLEKAPGDFPATEAFVSGLLELRDEKSSHKSALLGPHAASLLNQNQIKADLSVVGVVGGILLLLTLVFLGRKRALALLSLMGPLVIAIFVSIGICIGVFGSIHGLTLAFGPGLVGLVLDYGIHTKIHRGDREAWRSNLFGLLTTLSGFIVLGFSQIPLVRQLMVFSVSGLLVSFVLYYFQSQKKGKWWRSTHFEVFNFPTQPRLLQGVFSFVILLAAFLLIPFVKLDLNLKSFEYRQEHQSELESKLWGDASSQEVLFSVKKHEELPLSYEFYDFSKEHEIAYLSWSSFVPELSLQKKNLKTWDEESCNSLKFNDPLSSNFFEPFDVASLCSNHELTLSEPRHYVRDYLSVRSPEFLQVWKSKSLKDKEKLKSLDKNIFSFKDIFSQFPKTLLQDIWLMFPLGLLVCFLLILYHTKKVYASLLALVPMLTAVGAVFLSLVIFHKPLSFVSCVALLMIFGSSVDYGIFKVDSLRSVASQDQELKTFSSLFMNAHLTLIGYLPLLFAEHPVLNDLGWILSVGTLGAFIGGVWGVSFITSYVFKMNKL